MVCGDTFSSHACVRRKNPNSWQYCCRGCAGVIWGTWMVCEKLRGGVVVSVGGKKVAIMTGWWYWQRVREVAKEK